MFTFPIEILQLGGTPTLICGFEKLATSQFAIKDEFGNKALYVFNSAKVTKAEVY